MSMIVEKKRVHIITNSSLNDIVTNYEMLLGVYENVLQKLPSPLSQKFSEYLA